MSEFYWLVSYFFVWDTPNSYIFNCFLYPTNCFMYHEFHYTSVILYISTCSYHLPFLNLSPAQEDFAWGWPQNILISYLFLLFLLFLNVIGPNNSLHWYIYTQLFHLSLGIHIEYLYIIKNSRRQLHLSNPTDY